MSDKLNKNKRNDQKHAKNDQKTAFFNQNENNSLNVHDANELVNEVTSDFLKRQRDRKHIESQWQLNINFYLGNQYCSIGANGEVISYDKQFFWQEREVYNHIAPLVEIRLSKLVRVRPSLAVIPFSDELHHITSARVSRNILKAVHYKTNMKDIISAASTWSEVCGTGFYKVVWDKNDGNIIAVDEDGNNINEGDVSITSVSPFEIFPDSNSYENIEDCKSIIHARAYHKDTIKNIWGIDVEGGSVNVFSLGSVANTGGLGYIGNTTRVANSQMHDHAIVIEKYEVPSVEYPNGRLIIVAGNELVFLGDLPYINGYSQARGFPFIKQAAIAIPNSFWGVSIVDRCIPIQRSYNAVKNRKHEFLNRISMGVLAVEDGSVDTDDLQEDGLAPGKVLIYRQGSAPPRLLTTGSVPADFTIEEDRLLTEFLSVSGVSDLLRSTNISHQLSGIALQLLIEQDESRLSNTIESIRSAIKQVSQQVLRLYKQFAYFPKTSRLIGDDGSIELFYWNNSDISSDELVFETENEINQSLAQQRSMIFVVFNTGLLHDEDGKLSNSMRHKILEKLGFGVWESAHDAKSLQIKRANQENVNLIENLKVADVCEIDDHQLHIYEHSCFLLSDEFARIKKKHPKVQEMLLEHIREHKKFESMTEKIEQMDLLIQDPII